MPDRVRVDGLPDDRTVRVVHWYGGLRRNPASLHEPRLEVVLRVPKADGQSGYITREVGVTHQGLLPLGAEFTGQQQTGRIPLERADFQVDFSDQAFRIASAYDRIDGRFLIPTWQYALPDMQASQVVQFHTSEAASSLIIPCMEVFSKLYGRSRYVKQQLVKSSRFEEVLDNLIAPDVVHVPPDIGWGITLHTKCFNEDVLYVAHLKHDPVTQARTRAITRQIAAFDPRPQAPALHLKVQQRTRRCAHLSGSAEHQSDRAHETRAGEDPRLAAIRAQDAEQTHHRHAPAGAGARPTPTAGG